MIHYDWSTGIIYYKNKPWTARHPEFRPFWGGDILQAAKEGNIGAVRHLLQVDPQSLEQVDKDGGLLRKDRLEGWGGCYRFAAVTSQSVADTGFSRNMTDLWLCAWCRHHQWSLRRRAAGECGLERPPGGGRGAARRGRLREAKNSHGSGPQRRDGCDRDATRHWVCCQFWELRSRNLQWLQCTLCRQ